MTVTFWMPQAPEERVAPYPSEPDYFEVRAVEPFLEINMTAGNANAILALIAPEYVNYEEDPHGEWEVGELADIRRRCIVALNTPSAQSAQSGVREEVGSAGCRVTHYGRSQEYVEERLTEFLRLAKVAMEHGFPVSFG